MDLFIVLYYATLLLAYTDKIFSEIKSKTHDQENKFHQEIRDL